MCAVSLFPDRGNAECPVQPQLSISTAAGLRRLVQTEQNSSLPAQSMGCGSAHHPLPPPELSRRCCRFLSSVPNRPERQRSHRFCKKFAAPSIGMRRYSCDFGGRASFPVPIPQKEKSGAQVAGLLFWNFSGFGSLKPTASSTFQIKHQPPNDHWAADVMDVMGQLVKPLQAEAFAQRPHSKPVTCFSASSGENNALLRLCFEPCCAGFSF